MSSYINPRTGMPEGRWDKMDTQSHYWMVYKKFYHYADASAEEIIAVNKKVREAVDKVRDQLAEHQIDIINVATQQFLDPQHSNVIGVAVAFRSREDLAMAKMLVECDSVYGL